MSYRTITIRRIDVIGTIWMPAITAAMSYNLTPYDVENIGELTRENVEHWLMLNSGDFQSIEDFRVDIEDFESDWAKEESECIFSDCMYGTDY